MSSRGSNRRLLVLLVVVSMACVVLGKQIVKRTIKPEFSELVIVDSNLVKMSDYNSYQYSSLNTVEMVYDKALLQFNLAEISRSSSVLYSQAFFAEVQVMFPSRFSAMNSFVRRVINDEDYESITVRSDSSSGDWKIWNLQENKPMLKTESDVVWSWFPEASVMGGGKQVFPVSNYVLEAIMQEQDVLYLLMEGCTPDTIKSWSNEMGTARPSLEIEVFVDDSPLDWMPLVVSDTSSADQQTESDVEQSKQNESKSTRNTIHEDKKNSDNIHEHDSYLDHIISNSPGLGLVIPAVFVAIVVLMGFVFRGGGTR